MARKTTTSTEVKRRYNEKVYAQIAIQAPKDLAIKFKEKCKRENIPQRQVIIEAIENFLRE